MYTNSSKNISSLIYSNKFDTHCATVTDNTDTDSKPKFLHICLEFLSEKDLTKFKRIQDRAAIQMENDRKDITVEVAEDANAQKEISLDQHKIGKNQFKYEVSPLMYQIILKYAEQNLQEEK